MKIPYLVSSFVYAALSLPINNLLKLHNDGRFSNLKQSKDNDTNGSEVFSHPGFYHVYTGKNEITFLVHPLESLTYKDVNVGNVVKNVLFIFESNGNNTNVISVYRGGNVTKLMEGNDVTIAYTGENIYIATNNGIYTYKNNTIEKYGTLDDTFVSIALLNNTKLYALNEDRTLYKIINNGTKKEIVDEVYGAESIVTDTNDNIYYHNSKNDIFIFNNHGVRKVEGLPNNVTNIMLKSNAVPDGLLVIINKSIMCVIHSETCTIECDDTQPKFSAITFVHEMYFFAAVGNVVYEFDQLRMFDFPLIVNPFDSRKL